MHGAADLDVRSEAAVPTLEVDGDCRGTRVLLQQSLVQLAELVHLALRGAERCVLRRNVVRVDRCGGNLRPLDINRSGAARRRWELLDVAGRVHLNETVQFVRLPFHRLRPVLAHGTDEAVHGALDRPQLLVIHIRGDVVVWDT